MGQLCHGDQKDRRVPVQIMALNDTFITSAAGGGRHTLFLANDGAIYSCGYNVGGVLGHGLNDTSTYISIPQSVFGAGISGRIISMSAGNVHSLLLSDTKILYSFGFSDVCDSYVYRSMVSLDWGILQV